MIKTPYYLIDEAKLLQNMQKIAYLREASGAKALMAQRLPLLAAEARRSESRRSHKLNYRPYALMELGETPGRIQGWLTHLGWI